MIGWHGGACISLLLRRSITRSRAIAFRADMAQSGAERATAMQTGLILLPGGLATAVMMPIVGKLLQRGFPAQVMNALGFVFFFLFTLLLSHSTLASDRADFFWPLIAVSKLEMYTVSLNISRLFGTQREVQWGQIMAACFMSSLPLIVIFLVFRKSFISGITAGAFK